MEVPWKEKTIQTSLDLDYHYNIAGDRPISPLVLNLLETDGTLSDANKLVLATLIFNKYINNWTQLYKALEVTTYNPIENYNMVEHEEVDNDTTTTNNLTDTNDLESITTGGTTHEVTKDETTATSKTYGFNSSTAVDADEGLNSRKFNETNTYNSLKEENNGTVTHTGTSKDENDVTRDLTRSGNIGVTTSQQMIESEVELRKTNYYNQIYADINNILTLSIYE